VMGTGLGSSQGVVTAWNRGVVSVDLPSERRASVAEVAEVIVVLVGRVRVRRRAGREGVRRHRAEPPTRATSAAGAGARDAHHG
jgi:hypothetical protein